jgi:hypothetical protein
MLKPFRILLYKGGLIDICGKIGKIEKIPLPWENWPFEVRNNHGLIAD